MWKYVTRRIRDTFERSVNHFDRRSTTGVVNNSSNFSEEKNKQTTSPCKWFCGRKCWNETRNDNDTNSKSWNFNNLNRTWIGAITWSSALVLGWYSSQLIHLKLKYQTKDHKKCPSITNLITSLRPYLKNVDNNSSPSKNPDIDKIVAAFTPTVHLISNDQSGGSKASVNSASTSSQNTSSTDSDLGDVLNSIENKLGMAAIGNGQHKDGLNLLRSAANRHHAPALYNLGLCHEIGLGVPTDEKIAMEFYRSAAALRHPGALYNLGIYYGQGRGGLQRNPETAARLLRLAAVQGQKDAIDALKVLDLDITERPNEDTKTWSYNHTPYLHNDKNIAPSHSALFVENVNFLTSHNCETVY